VRNKLSGIRNVETAVTAVTAVIALNRGVIVAMMKQPKCHPHSMWLIFQMHRSQIWLL
jgi:hypothetical protein